jgi:hypothetical protein
MPNTIDLVFPDRMQPNLFLRYLRDMLDARGIKTIGGATIVDNDGAQIGRLLLANEDDESRAIQILTGTQIRTR